MPSDPQALVLDAVEERAGEMVELLATMVRRPSISGTDGENEAQSDMARLLADGGLDVDHWRIPLDELAAEDDFPGMEVPRTEAWGLVGRLPGASDGPVLMLNGHIDVVPTWRPGGVDRPAVLRRHTATGSSTDGGRAT